MPKPKTTSAERALESLIHMDAADLERLDTELLDAFALLSLRYAHHADRLLRRRRGGMQSTGGADHG